MSNEQGGGGAHEAEADSSVRKPWSKPEARKVSYRKPWTRPKLTKVEFSEIEGTVVLRGINPAAEGPTGHSYDPNIS